MAAYSAAARVVYILQHDCREKMGCKGGDEWDSCTARTKMMVEREFHREGGVKHVISVLDGKLLDHIEYILIPSLRDYGLQMVSPNSRYSSVSSC